MNLQQIVTTSILLFSGLVIGFILISFSINVLRKKIVRWITTTKKRSEIILSKQQMILESDNQVKKNSASVMNPKNRILKIPYSKRFKVINNPST